MVLSSGVSFAPTFDQEFQEALCVVCLRILTGIYGLHSYMRGPVLHLNLRTVDLEGLSDSARFLRPASIALRFIPKASCESLLLVREGCAPTFEDCLFASNIPTTKGDCRAQNRAIALISLCRTISGELPEQVLTAGKRNVHDHEGTSTFANH